MALSKHPRSADYLKWFTKHKSRAVGFADACYRVAGPRHTTAADIISGIGAQKAGGRWNPFGEMRVVYLSRSPETAVTESLAHFRYYNLPMADALPKVIISVEVSLKKVIDLMDAKLKGFVPDAMAHALAEDWRAFNSKGEESTSQAIGWAAFASGLHGIIVPSKPVPGGVNLLVFPEVLTKACRLVLQNEDALDRLGK